MKMDVEIYIILTDFRSGGKRLKILAVIPARAGSKGIPNKNIRLINGRPLVWYAINNAKKSKLISDIVISTDSYQIMMIAKQMDVRAYWRNERLCKDDVTLDSVVYDAVNGMEEHYDYIVTMQPTSPTLKAETLDGAIQYTIDHSYDTVISVYNMPHLSWRKQGDIVVPNYKERLNRQYLPANYLETGAFLISKSTVVTEESRMGESVSVYEISEEEAVDIDSFGDLKTAEILLGYPKIAIYVNGNIHRGLGHIYRSLELADEFYVKPTIFYDINQTAPEIFAGTTHILKGINGIGELLRILEKEQFDIFINDILVTSIDYMIAIRQALPNAKIVNFEDEGEGNTKADLVINALYEAVDTKKIKYGEKFYICPKMFMFYKPVLIREKVKRVFISFGGADPQGFTDRMIKILLKDKYKQLSFVIILGKAKENVVELMEYNKYENFEVLYDVKNMPEIMQQCDIAVAARGRTGYELAIMGMPTMILAQNEREERHDFMVEKNGFIYIGCNPSDYIIESNLDMLIGMEKEDRRKYQERLLSHDLKNGRKRVMELIFSC